MLPRLEILHTRRVLASALLCLIFGLPGASSTVVAQETTEWLTLNGEQADDDFGYFVRGIGRFNGDAYDDFMVSAVGYGSNNGRVYIYYGGATPNATPDHVLSAIGPNRIGYAIGAADFNGDGFRDALVGYDNGTLASGRVQIYFGGNPPPGTSGRCLLPASGSTFDASWVITSAGDLNKDGKEDVVANGRTSSGYGQVLIYYGRTGTTGPDLVPDVVIGTSDLNSNFGRALLGPGDITGDGNDDLAVGDATFGRVYVFRGNGNGVNFMPSYITLAAPSNWIGLEAGALSTIPGRRDLIVSRVDPWATTNQVLIYYGGAPWNNVADVTYINPAYAFGYALATTRLNGGEDKLMIGAPNADPNMGGAAFLHGVNSLPATQTLFGAAYDQLGWALAGGFDANGDGRGDYLVSYPNAGPGRVSVRIAVTGGGGKEPPHEFAARSDETPTRARLLSSAPEPFASVTRIRFSLADRTPASLAILDVRGARVRDLGPARASRGEQWMNWDGRDDAGLPAPSGIYFVELRTAGDHALKRITLLR